MLKSRLDELAEEGEDLVVARTSLSVRAADLLRDLILLEKLPPGQVLSERELSERLSISRTPLREAIRMIASEGLIEMQSHHRPKVADPSIEHIQNLFDVQAALEALAGRLFVARATDAQLAEVAAIQERLYTLADGPDPLAFFKLDMEFHSAIIRGAGNSALAATHQQYNAALFRARFMSSRQARWRDVTMAQHDEIVGALITRDGPRAEAALIDHLVRGKTNVGRIYEERSAAAERRPKQGRPRSRKPEIGEGGPEA